MSQDRHCIYEQLGYPSLFYRHKPSYTPLDVITKWEPNYNQNEIYKNEREVVRSKTRFFHCLQPTRWQNEPTIQQNDSEEEVDDDISDYSEELIIEQDHERKTTRRVTPGPFLHGTFLDTRVEPVLNAQRRALLRDVPFQEMIRKTYKLFDHSYIPATYRTAIEKMRVEESQRMALERQNNDPAYLAPFDYDSIVKICGDQDKDLKSDKKDEQDEGSSGEEEEEEEEEKKEGDESDNDSLEPSETQQTKTSGTPPPTTTASRKKPTRSKVKVHERNKPAKYGNCLACFKCPCCQSTWCLIHPTGELLSRVAISRLAAPYGDEGIIPTPLSGTIPHEVEIGEPIRQIEPCDTTLNTSLGQYFLVRTDNYATLICVKLRQFRLKARTESRTNPSQCLGAYKLWELTRIDLRSLSRYAKSYVPVDVACHGRYGNDIVPPKIAVLLRSTSTSDGEVNTIAVPQDIGTFATQYFGSAVARNVNTKIMAEQDVTLHRIGNLYGIHLIEFSSFAPSVLWSAATSFVRPKFSAKLSQLGHGSSLYSIDLRTNKATFQWSPSAADLVTEGVHSISGLKTDWEREHTLWVSSWSAGKFWEVDARMPYRVVNCWSMHGLYNDTGATTSYFDYHGTGSLISIPDSAQYNDSVVRPAVLVDKHISSLGLSVHQRATVRPWLGTESLEISNKPGFECVPAADLKPSIIRSAVFPLPEIATNVFTCGIGSFRTPVSDWMTEKQARALGYSNGPSKVMAVVTMTNKGDMYCHTLLECSVEEPSQAVQIEGSSLPMRILPLETDSGDEKDNPSWRQNKNGGMIFSLSVAKSPPTLSHQLAPFTVTSRDQCARVLALEGDFRDGNKRPRLEGEEIGTNLFLSSSIRGVYQRSGVDSQIEMTSKLRKEYNDELDDMVKAVEFESEQGPLSRSTPSIAEVEGFWSRHEENNDDTESDTETLW